MLSTGTPLADSTDTKVCRISLGAQFSPSPAAFVMIRKARITLLALSGVPIRDAKIRPWTSHSCPARALSTPPELGSGALGRRAFRDHGPDSVRRPDRNALGDQIQ
jgi:hypothetical protein